MGVAGLLATAVGATGVRSLADAWAEDREENLSAAPAFTLAEPAVQVAAVAPTIAGKTASIRTPATSGHVLPSPSAARYDVVTPSAAPMGTIRSAAHPVAPVTAARAVAPKAPTALPLPPVRTLASTSDAWFGDEPPARPSQSRPLADRGGRAIAVADAGPILDIDALIDHETAPAPKPSRGKPNGGSTSDRAERDPRAAPVVTPPFEQVLDGGFTGIDSDTGLSADDPTYGGAPVVPPPLDQVVDVGEIGMEFDPVLGSHYIPPARIPVDLPYDTIVNGGGLDLPPRHAMGAGWTPGDGSFQDVIVGPDGAIIVDARGVPISAPATTPEPTTLVAVGAGLALLARRGRRA